MNIREACNILEINKEMNIIKLKENIKQDDTIYSIRVRGFNNYE